MRKLLWILAALFIFGRGASAQTSIQQQADAAWNERSYARALELYRQVQGGNRDETDYRIAVSLGETQKWDEAIAFGQSFAARTPNKARILYYLGRLYTQVPHNGWKLGEKYWRGDDYPKTDDAQKPQQVYLSEQDAQRTLDYFEQAKIAAQNERMADIRGATHPLSAAEEIDLNFDLAAWVTQRENAQFVARLEKGETLGEVVDLTKRYSPEWQLPNKVLYLFNEIPRLDTSKDKHDSALALLAKGLWIRAYRNRMDAWAPKYDDKLKKEIVRSYPFDHLEEIPVWEELVEKFPRDEVAPRAQLLVAETHQQNGDLVKSLAAYRTLLAKFPAHKLANDARTQIQQITRPQLGFYPTQNAKPGEAVKLQLNTRNIRTVEFRAYDVKLENYLAQTLRLNNPDINFAEFQENFGSIAIAEKSFGKPVATWRLQTKEKGDYHGATETLVTPLKERGAYVVVAQSGSQRYAAVVLVTDLVVIKKTDRDNTFAYIADAKTGQPLSGANVVLKEVYSDNSNAKVSVARGTADDAGFYDKKLARGASIYSSRVEAFAWIGDRYAFTGAGWGGYGGYNDNRDEMRVYATTDRPVYRPAQKVHFRQILTRRVAGGDQQPVKGAKVGVTVTNPKGENIYQQTLTSSEFGTVNGTFSLPAGAPLGEYYLSANVENTTANVAASGGNRFRVEEYKRPEFLVEIDAPDSAVRPGETVAAKISAKYYFGSPVPNATVKYTVRRSTWWANYRFPSRYDWLYRYWNEGDYSTGRRNIGGEGSGAIVKEGTVKTDAQGIAEVSFKAEKSTVENDENNWWRYYQNPLYTIEAEITDASRRTIESQGSVRVANQEYFAFLNAPRGYGFVGDTIDIELRTQNANDKPLSTKGQMVVYKQLPDNKEEKIFTEPIETDASGKVFWKWQADVAGQFRIAYESTDAWGNKVVGSTSVWVAGDGLNTTMFRAQGVQIVLEKRDYEQGQTLKALLIADRPNTTVVLTHEAGGQILKRDLVEIKGKSREITINIEKMHVPNFAIAAAAVRDFEIYQTQQEVFVPPTRQVLNVSVTGDKKEYKPGETGKFTVTAKDWQGNPARAEVALALTDASLFYIQKSYAPDIRTFYYGERRAISVNIDSSKSGQPQPISEDDAKYQIYETHGFTLPDDLGKLNLDPGAGWGWYGNYGRRNSKSRGGATGGFGGGAGGFASDGAVFNRLESGPMMGSAPMPMASAPRVMALESSARKRSAGAVEADESAPLAEAKVRENFAETASWSPAVVTEGGTATVEVTFPDSLTQWHAEGQGVTQTAQVGAGETDVETKKNLLLRLQSPRFFTERDAVVLSANIHNYLKTDKRVRVSLQTGASLENAMKPNVRLPKMAEGTVMSQMSEFINVKAGEEVRVNWILNAVKDGDVSIQMTAQSDEESDAVKMNFPILVHGVQKVRSNSGLISGTATSAKFAMDIPKERRFGASQLNVQLNPSLAATMLDALPYLADYPYGCVEQTMSRFLPSVVAIKTLRDAGINIEQLRTRAKAYEKEAKTEAVGERVKNTGYTYPKGMPNSRDLNEMSSRLWHVGGRKNPIWDKATMDAMVADGLKRLYEMQREDGGWGWWPGSPQSDEYMSAYVVYGLATAKAANVGVRDDVLNRGYSYLAAQMKDEDNIHVLTYIAYSLSQRGNLPDDAKKIAAGRLFEQRDRLTAYSKSLLAMALDNAGEKEKAGVLVRNLENTARIDAAAGTARWSQNRDWWNWWNNDVETNAVALRAFEQVDPKNKLAPMLMKWLVTKSRGSHWRSTKETAEAVYALASYIKTNNELDVDYTVKVNLNGKIARTYRVTKDNALFFDNRFVTGDLFLQDGANTVTIEKTGKGNVYYSAFAEYFSLEEPITASGNAIAVKRRFFKLTRNAAVKPEQGDAPATSEIAPAAASRRIVRPIMPRPVPAQPAEPEYTRGELKDNAELKSGDLVEVELTIDSDNDYEYLVFEDMKAAGLEPVDIRSGGAWGDGLSSNVELRDEKVAFFVDRLPQGTRVLRYRVRAEVPGRFHALPTNGYAMYAPEVRAISDEMRLGIND
ncbi:MAG TPA: MG2 domain-containing protein [Abditibacteriaceae bacterium]|jgi:hypothetical protein